METTPLPCTKACTMQAEHIEGAINKKHINTIAGTASQNLSLTRHLSPAKWYARATRLYGKSRPESTKLLAGHCQETGRRCCLRLWLRQ